MTPSTHHRSATFELGRADPAQRLVPVVLSTETPYDRGSYVEILDHAPSSVDLSRAPLPLIESHDGERLPIGVVENVRVEGRKLRGIARFGSSARALEVYRDVVDGVIRSVSVGYQQTRELARDGRTVRFAFLPFECSAVAVPADPTAGFFRSQDTHMTTETTAGEPGTSTRMSGHSMANERERVGNITAIAQRWNPDPELVQQAIAEGWAADRFGRTVLQGIHDRQAPITTAGRILDAGIGLSPREAGQFSLLRAIRAKVENDPRVAPFEMEASRAVGQKLGREARAGGFFVPHEVLRRDLTAAGATTGSKLVPTEHRPQDFIELLRRRSMFINNGATMIGPFKGNAAIPRQTGAGTAYWLASEATAITESDPTIGQILMTPKNVGAYTEISRQLMIQAVPAADMMVMNDLAQVVALAVDQAVVTGTGAGGQPLGIFSTAGIGSFSTVSCNYTKLLEAQTDLNDSNALTPSCFYLTTSAVALALSARQRFASTDTALWNGSIADGQVAGFRALTATFMPANNILFLDPTQVVIGEWGALELEVNPYANFAAGITGIRAWWTVDLALRQPGAATLSVDFT
jgi:HK97 family phage major capsid protein